MNYLKTTSYIANVLITLLTKVGFLHQTNCPFFPVPWISPTCDQNNIKSQEP